MRPAMTRKAPSHKDAPRIAALLWAFGLPVLLSPPAQAAPARFGGRPNAAPASGSIGVTTILPVKWAGTAIGTGNTSETTGTDDNGGIEGTNADTYTLNVLGSPADWAGKSIQVQIAWTVPANDYDLYVHKGSNTGTVAGSSATGAPGTSETVTINPSATGTGVYTVHMLYFTNTPGVDQPQGTASVVTTPPNRTATYSTGNFTFSNDVPLKGPQTTSDGEPSSRTDTLGNFYVSGIRGFPAGVDLWYFDLKPSSPTYDPLMQFPLYRGQPDGFTGNLGHDTGVFAGGDGGGDIDLSVGFPADGSTPSLSFASLIAANLSTGTSADTGLNYTLNPGGNVTGGIPGDDRQWLESFGSQSVYILYRTLDPAVAQIQRSNDHGLTYGPTAVVGQTGQIGQTGGIDVDPTDGAVFLSGSDGVVAVGLPERNPLTGGSLTDPVTGTPAMPLLYTIYPAASDPAGVAHLFFQVAVARDSGTGAGKNGKPYGTVYVLYSNDHGVFLKYSMDRGKTYSNPVQVNPPYNAADPKSTFWNIFPRMALGKAFGSVGIVWYGTTDTGAAVPGSSAGSQQALWSAFYALTRNATAATPNFATGVATNHYIHAGNVSEGGLVVGGVSPNRNLLDYFEISYDPTGAAVIGYTDDHNDFSGNCFAVRQVGGTTIDGGTVPTPQEGPMVFTQPLPQSYARPPAIPGPFGAQVVDFPNDVSIGLIVTVPTPDPLDITSIKYYAVQGARGPQILAKMTVSNLSTIPPASTWRMNFTVNGPQAGLDPTGTFTGAMSDLGDQFYLEADTSAAGAQTGSWGMTVRNIDGSLTNTKVGTPDGVSFDPTRGTITVSLTVSDINQYLSAHGRPLINQRTIFAGLRGTAFDTSGTARADSTYGGTQFSFPFQVF